MCLGQRLMKPTCCSQCQFGNLRVGRTAAWRSLPCRTWFWVSEGCPPVGPDCQAGVGVQRLLNAPQPRQPLRQLRLNDLHRRAAVSAYHVLPKRSLIKTKLVGLKPDLDRENALRCCYLVLVRAGHHEGYLRHSWPAPIRQSSSVFFYDSNVAIIAY